MSTFSCILQKVGEYDQVIPYSYTADQPWHLEQQHDLQMQVLQMYMTSRNQLMYER